LDLILRWVLFKPKVVEFLYKIIFLHYLCIIAQTTSKIGLTSYQWLCRAMISTQRISMC